MAAAQQAPAAPPANSDKPAVDSSQAPSNEDPLKRTVPDKVKKEQSKALRKEISKTYKKWLDEDVRWIITDEEKRAFSQLSNDEERDNFIEQFWERRNPTPDSPENEYKEEHYRRIAYANDHFAAGIPGWKTDRGRIYIMYGPADEVDAHPSGGTYDRPEEEGGGTTSTFPFETWRYRYLEGVGQEIVIEFVDSCMCGDYHMTIDRSEKDAFKHAPGMGLSDYEAMGLADPSQRYTNGLEQLPTGPMTNMQQGKEFDRLDQFAKINRPPAIKFKDLAEQVTHKITVNVLPFDVRWDFVRVTGDTVLVPITVQIQNKDVTFVNKDGVQRATVNIFGRVTGLTGRIAQTFEDPVQIDVPPELLEKTAAQASVYQKAVPLRPGHYRLDLVLKDVNGDRMGNMSRSIQVPEFSEDRLAASTLILAYKMEKVATNQVGTGSFVIGDTKVWPRVAPSNGNPATFKRSQRANVWMQVYNLSVDQKTHKPDATIEYHVVKLAVPAQGSTPAVPEKLVVDAVESTAQMGNVGEQLTLEKSLPLTPLEPGTYEITIKVADKVSNKSLEPVPTARFVVEDDRPASSGPMRSQNSGPAASTGGSLR
jgi:GWxTD domain-containing protein